MLQIEPKFGLGIDQAMKASGLCLVRWNPVGGSSPVWWRTVKNLNAEKVNNTIAELSDFLGFNKLDTLALEGVFWSPDTPRAGFSGSLAMGMWLQAVCTQWKACRIAEPLTARAWRMKYFGPGLWKREIAEAESVKLAQAHGILKDLTVHIGDALGIVSVAMQKSDCACQCLIEADEADTPVAVSP